jgi:hypothetical protein
VAGRILWVDDILWWGGGGGEEHEEKRKCLKMEMGVDRCEGEVAGLCLGGRHPLYGAVWYGIWKQYVCGINSAVSPYV